jgi:hypothetical protein
MQDYGTSVGLHDRVHQGESQPRPFTHAFGREKGLEDPLLQLGRNAGPIILDRDLDRFPERDTVSVV